MISHINQLTPPPICKYLDNVDCDTAEVGDYYVTAFTNGHPSLTKYSGYFWNQTYLNEENKYFHIQYMRSGSTTAVRYGTNTTDSKNELPAGWNNWEIDNFSQYRGDNHPGYYISISQNDPTFTIPDGGLWVCLMYGWQVGTPGWTMTHYARLDLPGGTKYTIPNSTYITGTCYRQR